MRNFISYILIAITAVSMAGCLNVNVSLVEPQDPTKVTLQLRNADLVATRAVTDDNLFNEDLIVSAQCFFTATDSDAVLHATDLIQINQQQTKTLNLEIPADKISSLFGTTTKCDVYVVANYGEKITDDTITAIKNKPITLGTDAIQKSFVMDGKAEVILSGTSLSGTVDLYRAAAKIVVKANINTSITEGGITWTPETDAITMKYTGSIANSMISANAADGSVTENLVYGQTTNVFTKDKSNSTDAEYVGYQTTPFYSFPVAADKNKGEIDMVIPWKTGDNEVEYTYQIPVNIALERNHVYIIEVNVEVLGNLEGAELNPSYTVVDWTENPITAELSKPKYLVVEETQVVMNNVNSYSIPYSSSDVVSAVITSITKPNYSKEEISMTTIYSGNGITSVSPTSGNTSPFIVSVNDGNIVLSHNLNNINTSNQYDYVPYTIKVKVTSGQFIEYIDYVQYPAMYINAETNPGGNKLSNTGYDKGHVFVYGNQSENVSDWYVVRSCEQGNNNNPNMYVITTTSLDASSSYMLSDPRSTTSQTGRNLGLTSSFNGENLTYYYQSLTNNDNYLAPVFRIASSYGKCGSAINYSDATKRCAAYQEYGYPAGRWRVPTTAEMKYIAMISSKGWIPHLFSNGSYYWSATERIRYNTNGDLAESNNTNNSAYVRCVYDEWYWNDKCDLKTFTWGDAPRN